MNRYGRDTKLLEISEITTSNAIDVNTVHGQLQILQQKISALETESHAGETFSPPSYILGGRNEEANLRYRNQCGDRSIHKVKFQISSQFSSKCMISEPHPSTPVTNKMDYNDYTWCLGKNFIVMAMT